MPPWNWNLDSGDNKMNKAGNGEAEVNIRCQNMELGKE